MKLKDVIKKLKSMRNPVNVKGMARFGITGRKVLGVQIYKLRDMAKSLSKRNPDLNKKAVKVAKELKQSSSKAAKWVGSNAFNELTSVKVQKRLMK